jgi:hypothetical protein
VKSLLCLGHLKRLDDTFEWVIELCAGAVLEGKALDVLLLFPRPVPGLGSSHPWVVIGIFVLKDVEVSDARGCSGNLGWGLLV